MTDHINEITPDPDQMKVERAGVADLAVMLGGAGDSFTGRLLELIAKADGRNTERLAIAYPHEVQAYALWQTLGPGATMANVRSLLPADPFAEITDQHIAAARRYFHFTILDAL